MLSVLVVRLPVAIALADVERAKLWLDKLRGLLRSRASWQDLQNLWLFRGEVERVAGRREAAQQAYQTALNLGRERGLANAGILLKLASLALEVGELQRARSSLDELSSVDSASSVHSHELRSTRSILQVELAARLGDADAAGGALQDAEITVFRGLLPVENLLLPKAPLDRAGADDEEEGK